MHKATTDWYSIREKDLIPEIVKIPTAMQLFMFSAVTWNRHLIHYNKEYALHDGLEDLAVHRALLGNFLSQMLTDWIGESGRILKIDWNVRASAKPGDNLYCRGEVKKKYMDQNKRIIECEIRIEKENGILIAPGKGIILFYKN